jgi:predicted Holliday junction resolvase-like endonuclease
MAETILAAVVLALCLALLVRLMLPPRQRQRMDSRARQGWNTLRRSARAVPAVWHHRRHRKQAASEAEAAIRRARDGFSRDGNVIRPKSFKRPRKPH